MIPSMARPSDEDSGVLSLRELAPRFTDQNIPRQPEPVAPFWTSQMPVAVPPHAQPPTVRRPRRRARGAAERTRKAREDSSSGIGRIETSSDGDVERSDERSARRRPSGSLVAPGDRPHTASVLPDEHGSRRVVSRDRDQPTSVRPGWALATIRQPAKAGAVGPHRADLVAADNAVECDAPPVRRPGRSARVAFGADPAQVGAVRAGEVEAVAHERDPPACRRPGRIRLVGDPYSREIELAPAGAVGVHRHEIVEVLGIEEDELHPWAESTTHNGTSSRAGGPPAVVCRYTNASSRWKLRSTPRAA